MPDHSTPAPLIAATRLARSYQSDGVAVHALRAVDLTIHRGEFVAIMGPSGCGKSTLLHMLGALDTPEAGEVTLDGRQLSALDDKALTDIRRRQIGIVFQFFNLVPVLTAEENIALPALIDGASRDDRGARVDALMAATGLTGVRSKLPSQLSGGQQQRVAIARALINEPDVVLADEPTGNLDLRSGLEIMALFTELHQRGQTIVVVTHDPNIARFAARVVFMQDGRLVDELEVGPSVDAAAIASRLVALEPDPA